MVSEQEGASKDRPPVRMLLSDARENPTAVTFWESHKLVIVPNLLVLEIFCKFKGKLFSL